MEGRSALHNGFYFIQARGIYKLCGKRKGIKGIIISGGM